MYRIRSLIFSLVLFFVCTSFGQNTKLDSLLKVIQTSSSRKEVMDSKAKAVYKLFLNGKEEDANRYYRECLEEALKSNYSKVLPVLYINFGNMHYLRSRLDSSKHYYQLAFNVALKNTDTIMQIKSINNLANIDYMNGENKKALEMYTVGLKLEKSFRAEEGEYISLNNIAKIYMALNIVSKAKYYFLQSKARYESLGDFDALTFTYEGLCDTYTRVGQNDSAIYFANKTIEACERSGDLYSMGYSYNSLGILYDQLKNFDEAKRNYQKGVKISKLINDKRLEMALQCNLGMVYKETGELNLARGCFDKVMFLQRTFNIPIDKKDIYGVLAEIEAGRKNYKDAFYYQKLFGKIKDSIYNINITQQVAELNEKYQAEKREKQNLILKKENESNTLEIRSQRSTRNYLVIIIILCVLVIAGSIVIFKKIRKVNSELSEKNNDINEKNTVLEHQKKEILDSIHYAKRIQNTLLAHTDFVNSNIPDNFILFKPKDIVSGDFYWATKRDHLFYIAVCDSTGHGVPGAFMSLLNIGFLSEAINEKDIFTPNKVLDYVRDRLISTISKEGQKDGFDGILLCLDTKNKKLSYAAANNEPILISNSEVIELGKDKMPVGKGVKEVSFQLFDLELKEGETLYLYTDGYADQFGGPKGKKFLYKKLNQLIASLADLPLNIQKEKLEKTFEEWKGGLEQVDDVLLIGLKV